MIFSRSSRGSNIIADLSGRSHYNLEASMTQHVDMECDNEGNKVSREVLKINGLDRTTGLDNH